MKKLLKTIFVILLRLFLVAGFNNKSTENINNADIPQSIKRDEVSYHWELQPTIVDMSIFLTSL